MSISANVLPTKSQTVKAQWRPFDPRTNLKCTTAIRY